ncbi:portal protein [Vibrio phage 1.076.O._10N.286.51.B7]|nr:portal protein [Vibrio phage 1.076.O._10N.286.51.B7]
MSKNNRNNRKKSKITTNSGNGNARNAPQRSSRIGSSNVSYELVGGYNGADRKRQVWDQAGYPELVLPEMLWNSSRRNGIARGILNLKAGESWQDDPIIYDGDEDPKRREANPTEFEIAIDKWAEEWELWERLAGADKRQMVMRYSGIIIFAREPKAAKPEDEMQVLAGPEAITKLMPVFETEIEVLEGIQDPMSPDYGQPKNFHFRSETTGSRNTWIERDFTLHPSRVVTFAEGADDGSIYGISEFESYYNALLDLEKIRMSGGEGFYKNASQKISINLDPKLTQGLSEDEQDAFDENIDDFNRDMNKALVLAGAEAKSLQATMSDPKEYAQLAYNEIAAGSGIPLTIIIGMQTGRLASDEDQTQKNVLIQTRQKKWNTPMIKKFLKRLIKHNALPQPTGKINVCWPDISEPSFKDKIDAVDKMMTTNERAVKAQQGPIFSEEYMQEFAGVEVEELERLPAEGEGIDPAPIVE